MSAQRSLPETCTQCGARLGGAFFETDEGAYCCGPCQSGTGCKCGAAAASFADWLVERFPDVAGDDDSTGTTSGGNAPLPVVETPLAAPTPAGEALARDTLASQPAGVDQPLHLVEELPYDDSGIAAPTPAELRAREQDRVIRGLRNAIRESVDLLKVHADNMIGLSVVEEAVLVILEDAAG